MYARNRDDQRRTPRYLHGVGDVRQRLAGIDAVWSEGRRMVDADWRRSPVRSPPGRRASSATTGWRNDPGRRPRKRSSARITGANEADARSLVTAGEHAGRYPRLVGRGRRTGRGRIDLGGRRPRRSGRDSETPNENVAADDLLDAAHRVGRSGEESRPGAGRQVRAGSARRAGSGRGRGSGESRPGSAIPAVEPAGGRDDEDVRTPGSGIRCRRSVARSTRSPHRDAVDPGSSTRKRRLGRMRS